jgi:hypothetical protein
VDAAQVFWFEGKVAAQNAAEITNLFLNAGGGAKMDFAWGADKPAKLEKLVAGESTICLIPVNGNLMDPQFAKRIQEHVDKLKVYCEPFAVAPTPKEQSHTAVIPAMDPLPDPT